MYLSTSRNGKRRFNDLHECDKDDERKKLSHGYDRKHSHKRTSESPIAAGKILPGASSLEDINSFVNAAKKEKLNQLRKKSNF